MKNYILILLSIGLLSCTAKGQEIKKDLKIKKIVKSDSEWKQILTPTQYYVTRQKGTERAFSGEYNSHKGKGVYNCVACKNPLFHSETKFDSGSGWPSYYQPVSNISIQEIDDITFGMIRTEVVCAKCDAHLGHVFKDGPKPTGLRYCINSVSLLFEEEIK